MEEIKKVVANLAGEEKVRYLRGLRDGADLCQIICDDRKFGLASNKEFQAFLNYLDEEK